MSKTDFVYLKIWCDSVTFVRGYIFLTHPVDMYGGGYEGYSQYWPVRGFV